MSDYREVSTLRYASIISEPSMPCPGRDVQDEQFQNFEAISININDRKMYLNSSSLTFPPPYVTSGQRTSIHRKSEDIDKICWPIVGGSTEFIKDDLRS